MKKQVLLVVFTLVLVVLAPSVRAQDAEARPKIHQAPAAAGRAVVAAGGAIAGALADLRPSRGFFSYNGERFNAESGVVALGFAGAFLYEPYQIRFGRISPRIEFSNTNGAGENQALVLAGAEFKPQRGPFYFFAVAGGQLRDGSLAAIAGGGAEFGSAEFAFRPFEFAYVRAPADALSSPGNKAQHFPRFSAGFVVRLP